MRLLVLMLTFVLLTPLLGCKTVVYWDEFEAENNAKLFKKARENRRLKEKASQERKDDTDSRPIPEEERKR